MIESIKAQIVKPFWSVYDSVYDGVYDGALDNVTKCYIGNYESNHDGIYDTNYDPVLMSEFGSLLIANGETGVNINDNKLTNRKVLNLISRIRQR